MGPVERYRESDLLLPHSSSRAPIQLKVAERDMDVFELTRALVDIPSVTPEEEQVGLWLFDYIARIADKHSGTVEKILVEPGRFNIVATFGTPLVTLSTHIDTVPPFIPSSEDDEFIWGRGACDTTGIIASMLTAAERLLEAGVRDIGLLFLVGEERNSAGAWHASEHRDLYPAGTRYIINGEPTSNQLALGSKGALRFELTAHGKMAHSAYPELGESAIDKLVVALTRLRAMRLPEADGIGPCTLNVGLIEGGRAPNVIPDHAKAHLLYRLVGPTGALRKEIVEIVGELARVDFYLEIPFMRFRSIDGLPTMIAAYTTDIPALGNWGEPLLVGPGSIHVAHTDGEYVDKKQLVDAVDLYTTITGKLLTSG